MTQSHLTKTFCKHAKKQIYKNIKDLPRLQIFIINNKSLPYLLSKSHLNKFASTSDFFVSVLLVGFFFLAALIFKNSNMKNKTKTRVKIISAMQDHKKLFKKTKIEIR